MELENNLVEIMQKFFLFLYNLLEYKCIDLKEFENWQWVDVEYQQYIVVVELDIEKFFINKKVIFNNLMEKKKICVL